MSSTLEGGQSTKKRKTFASLGKKNEYDSRNKKQLAKHLDEWFERTRLPIVALILDETKDKKPFVRYAGSPHFKEFYQDQEVVNKFVKVAMDGLQKAEANEGVKPCEEEKASGNNSPFKGIEENAARMVLHADVMNLQIGMKLNLIGQLIKGLPGRKKKWIQKNRPSWWPFQSFGSPNSGSTRLTVTDADTVLLACRNFLLGKEDGDIEEVGQEGGEGEHEDEENGDEEEVRLEGVEEEGVEMDGLASGQNDDDMTVDATVHDDDVGIDTDCTVVEREREGSDNESSNIVPTEILDCNYDENLFISEMAEMCKPFRWSAQDAELFLNSVPRSANISALEKLIQLLPMTMPMKKTTAELEFDFWFRHQVPETLKDTKEPIYIERGTNSLFHAASVSLYGSSMFWPAIRLLSAKYGIARFSSVMAKLREMEPSEARLVDQFPDRGRPSKSLEEAVRLEIIRTMWKDRDTSVLHLVLLSEALGVTVRCHSVDFNHVHSVNHEFPAAVIDLIWTSDPNETETHFCPLVFPRQRLVERYDSICAAGAICAARTSLVASQEKIHCRNCLRPYHVSCLGTARKDNPQQPWSCFCNVTKEKISRTKKYDSENLPAIVQRHKCVIQKHLKAILRKLQFSWHIQKFWDDDFQELEKAYDRFRWFLVMTGAQGENLLLEQVAAISQTLPGMYKLSWDDRITLNKFVFQFELVALIIHEEEQLPLIAAKKILLDLLWY